MRTVLATLIFILALAMSVAALADPLSKSQDRGGKGGALGAYVEGEVLVKFKEGLADYTVQDVLDKMDSRVRNASLRRGGPEKGVTVAKHFSGLDRAKGGKYMLVTSGLSTAETVRMFKADSRVAAVSPNYIRHVSALPSENSTGDFPAQWGLNNTGQLVNGVTGLNDADIDAPEAWDTRTSLGDVVVAVIDTGVDYTHEDLVDNMWVNAGETPNDGIDNDNNGYVDDVYGADVYNADADPMDDNGHGTHVAGITAATGNNGIGIAGVAWTGSVMALKTLDAVGAGTDDLAITAIEYIIGMYDSGVNVKVINASWGGAGYNQLLYDAIALCRDRGIIFVAAAGNEHKNVDKVPHYPACFELENIVPVSATTQDDILAPTFSNWGLFTVNVAAPGQNILSTLPGSSSAPTGDVYGSDDFSSDPFSNGWSHYGDYDTWGWDGAQVLDSPGANYQNNTMSTLESPTYDLSTASDLDQVRLSFDAILDLETDYDFLYVYMSGDNWVSWHCVAALTGNAALRTYSYFIPERLRTNSFSVKFILDSDESYTYSGVTLDNLLMADATTGSDTYEYYQGTSMASPLVAGAAALLVAEYPAAEAWRIIDRLYSGTDSVPALDGMIGGSGRLNLNNSIDPSLTLHPMLMGATVKAGLKPGDTTTLTGHNFGGVQGTVIFGGQSATVTNWSDTAITCTVPEGGLSDVSVNDGVNTSQHMRVSSWERKAAMHTARDSFASAEVGGKIYVFGGYEDLPSGASQVTNLCEVFDPASNTWTEIAPMPTARAQVAAVAVDGDIYVMGGFNDVSTLTTVEIYHTASNTWSTGGAMLTAIAQHRLVYLGGYIYIVGGYNGSTGINTLMRYDIAGATWSSRAAMSQTRFEHGAVVVDGKIIVFGGAMKVGENLIPLKSVEIYDPVSNSWTPGTDMPMEMARMGYAADLNGSVYSVGGTGGHWWIDAERAYQVYDPVGDSWTYQEYDLKELDVARLAGKLHYVDGYGLISIGGSNNYLAQDVTELLSMETQQAPGEAAMTPVYLLLLN